MGPGNENSGRGEYFRALLGRPATITALVVGGVARARARRVLPGRARRAPRPRRRCWSSSSAAPSGSPTARRRRCSGSTWRASIGYTPFYDPTALETTTPLLHAGDRRFWDHELKGPLGDTGLEALFAQYRYEVREEDSKGNETWDRYPFTICLVELEPGMQLFPGVYLREKRGLLSFGRHDWLRGRGLQDVELESTQFNETYELKITREQDQARLRELFDPKTIVWLQDHPLRPHIEFRAGFLVVYVPGHLDDLGRIVWLLEATEKIAERVQAEVGEAHTARERRVGSGGDASPPCSSRCVLAADADAPAFGRRTSRSATAAPSASSTARASAGARHDIHNYRFRLTRQCFCPPAWAGAVRPQRQAGAAARAKSAASRPCRGCSA